MLVAGLLLVLAALWALAYFGVPLWLWAMLSLAGYMVLMLISVHAGVILVVAGLPVVALLLLVIRPIRRVLFTRHAFAMLGRKLPPISETERVAIEAGECWWEAQLFRGRPDWKQLTDFQYTDLSAEERSFLDGECQTLCAMVDDWKIDFETRDLPREVWDFLRQRHFFAMLIKKEYGGLEFSSVAQSAVVTKLATKSIALAVTVMVPNSLGPGELLQRYGTEEQRNRWLPSLAKGSEIPCFGLTGLEAGSDATAMPDIGVVGHGEFEGRRVLGIRLSFSKRWITLAPVATVVGLAFKLRDPDGLLGDPARTDYGITCALVPAGHPGVKIGSRHYPGVAFMNGPVSGRDVFIPVEWIIGGPKMAGQGWRMLVECLSAGRGISLPALATAAAQSAYRVTGAYSRIRRQFKVAIGHFEGVQEATGRIGGLTYTLEAMRVMTASAVDHCTPSVVTALAKYHMTEMMRQVVQDAMDVFGGRGVQQGPRNPIAPAYKAVPVAITVEGANILTRSLMIFGQGALRSHQYLLGEMEAVRAGDLRKFDHLLWAHLGTTINRAVRAFTFGLSGATLARAPVRGAAGRYFRQLERMSAALNFATDAALAVLGGNLKRRERLSARLGDVLSQLYIASCVLKYYLAHGEKNDDLPHVRWALDHALAEAGRAFDGFLRNFPNRTVATLMRWIIFPLGIPYRPVADELNSQVAAMIMEHTALRDRLCHLVYVGDFATDPVGRIEKAFRLLCEVEPAYLRFYRWELRESQPAATIEERVASAVGDGIIDEREAAKVMAYEIARYDALQTDDFDPADLKTSAEVAIHGASTSIIHQGTLLG